FGRRAGGAGLLPQDLEQPGLVGAGQAGRDVADVLRGVHDLQGAAPGPGGARGPEQRRPVRTAAVDTDDDLRGRCGAGFAHGSRPPWLPDPTCDYAPPRPAGGPGAPTGRLVA